MTDPRIEAIAKAFHDAYEIHAAGEGWETQEASRTTFDDLPEANKQTMLKTIQSLLDDGVIALPDDGQSILREYADRIKGFPPMSYEQWLEWKYGDPTDELLFFATYIGPLVIGIQEDYIRWTERSDLYDNPIQPVPDNQVERSR